MNAKTQIAGLLAALMLAACGGGFAFVKSADAGDGLRFAWGVAPGGAIFRNGVKQ